MLRFILDVVVSVPGAFVMAAFLGYAIWGMLVNANVPNFNLWMRVNFGVGGGLVVILGIFQKATDNELSLGQMYVVWIGWIFAMALMFSYAFDGLVELLHKHGMLPGKTYETKEPDPEPRVAEPTAEYKVKEPTPEEKVDEILRRNRRE